MYFFLNDPGILCLKNIIIGKISQETDLDHAEIFSFSARYFLKEGSASLAFAQAGSLHDHAPYTKGKIGLQSSDHVMLAQTYF